MIDWRTTILSQYSNSPTITSLIEGIAKILDPTEDLAMIQKRIFDPTLATGNAIKTWSEIVAMESTNGVDVEEGDNYFGYDKSRLHPYDNYPFVHDEPGSGRFEFTDASLQTLVMAKALANISTATLPVLKDYLKQILGSEQFALSNEENTAGVGGEMAVKFVISGTKPVTMQLFRIYAPKVVGAGVKIIYQVSGSTFFGFQGMEIASPFGQGVFYDAEGAGWQMGEI